SPGLLHDTVPAVTAGRRDRWRRTLRKAQRVLKLLYSALKLPVVCLQQSDLAVSKSLFKIFSEVIKGEPMHESAKCTLSLRMASATKEATPEEKAEAEQLKNEGNQLMKDDKFTE
ncbi:hypothetical protein OTU49_000120, partial [Cherax quadricarinatus]